MELGSVNIVLNIAQFSQDGELSDHHFGVLIVLYAVLDMLDGADLFGVAVLCLVNLSIGSRTYELFDFIVFS